MPIATYQLYAFVIPAFAEQHHKHLKPLVMMIPALFVCGVIFGWYLVVPPAIDFLVGYNTRPSTTSCAPRTTSSSCC